MNNTIYGIDLTRALPPTLKNDEDMLALARVIGAELQETGRMIRQNIIYPGLMNCRKTCLIFWPMTCM